MCFLASYLVACGLEFSRLRKESAITRAFLLTFGFAGLIAHTVYLFVRSSHSDLPPLLSSSHDWLLVLAWLGVVVYLFLTTVDRKLAIGLFLLPVILLLIAGSYFVSDAPIELIQTDSQNARAVSRNVGMLHAGLLVLGATGVLAGLVLSLMYLVQHRRLKHKSTLQKGLRLPSLAKLARLNWWAVVISVPMLTLGMASGVWLGFQTKKSDTPISFADPVIVVYGIVWLALVVFLTRLLRTRKTDGKRVAWWTVLAFGFMLITILGLQIMAGGSSLESWHDSQVFFLPTERLV
jgi:ABC-type uncharacterized transport system permease subunit